MSWLGGIRSCKSRQQQETNKRTKSKLLTIIMMYKTFTVYNFVKYTCVAKDLLVYVNRKKRISLESPMGCCTRIEEMGNRKRKFLLRSTECCLSRKAHCWPYRTSSCRSVHTMVRTWRTHMRYLEGERYCRMNGWGKYIDGWISKGDRGLDRWNDSD